MNDLNLQEQIVRIDKALAEIHRTNQESEAHPLHIQQIVADIERKRQEIRLAPWQLILAGVGATAALLAAGGAIGALLVKLWPTGVIG